jgi:hypothetical protein
VIDLKPEDQPEPQPEPATAQLARDMIQLDEKIRTAARENRWYDAEDLSNLRQNIAITRSGLMRRQWAESGKS